MALWETAALDLSASRWTPFVRDIDVIGYDLTGAAFAAVVRDSEAVGSTARATLATQATDVEGVRLVSVETADAADVEAYAAAGVTISVGTSISHLRIRINEATMEAMDVAADAGEPDGDGVAHWDMHITPSGGDKFRAFAGAFTIFAGATQ